MRIVTACLALAWSPTCYAQSVGSPVDSAITRPVAGSEGWTLTVGVAPILAPAWQGSRDMAFSIYPDLRLSYGDTLFASVPDGVGWNALNEDGWKAGPLAKIRFGRDEEDGGSPFLIAGGSDALRGLGDIGATAELGGFVEKRMGNREQWRLRVEVRKGFGGHEGVVADVSLGYQARSGRTVFTIGPRASLASTDFMQTYFGIDSGQNRRSGLDEYAPDAGVLSYGIGASVFHPFDRNSAVILFTGVDLLGEPAENSPLVRERGRSSQFTIGLGYGYRFSL